jgi:hypothetical protein
VQLLEVQLLGVPHWQLPGRGDLFLQLPVPIVVSVTLMVQLELNLKEQAAN